LSILNAEGKLEEEIENGKAGYVNGNAAGLFQEKKKRRGTNNFHAGMLSDRGLDDDKDGRGHQAIGSHSVQGANETLLLPFLFSVQILSGKKNEEKSDKQTHRLIGAVKERGPKQMATTSMRHCNRRSIFGCRPSRSKECCSDTTFHVTNQMTGSFCFRIEVSK
jgi:hypothetical protein